MTAAEATRADPAAEDHQHGIGMPTEEAFERLQRWRVRVVRLWLATMITALAILLLLAAFQPPAAVQYIAALALFGLAGLALRSTREGLCPYCQARIRFEPRIGLPPACHKCAMPFFATR